MSEEQLKQKIEEILENAVNEAIEKIIEAVKQEKDGYGTGALKQHRSFKKNKKELDKCVLVCVRCHREIHAEEVVL